MDADRQVAAEQANRQSDAAGARTSTDLEAFMRAWEGESLAPYPDIGGKWTVGIGHLMLPGESHDPITPERMQAIYDADMGRISAGVASCVTAALEQHQVDALCAFAFNEGVQALRDSTLLRLINMGQFIAAAFEFPKWNKAHVGGVLQVVEGLMRRRAAERAMFEIGDYSGRP